VLAIANIGIRGAQMTGSEGSGHDVVDLPASLKRRVKEPTKLVQLRIPLSWWEELSGLAREFDQDVSTFLREATEDWLQKARKVQQQKND
jgi:hypothetical protein